MLAGGGHAHVEVLRDLGARPDPRLELVVATAYPWLTYSGMVPGFVAGHYEIDECMIDLRPLAARANARLVITSVVGVDADAREVRCANGDVIPYDVLSLDVGLRPAVDGTRGLERHAVLLRPLENAVKGWSDVLVRAREGRIGAVTVAGGGAAGVELALAMEYRLCTELGLASTHVRVISDAGQLVPGYPGAARRRLRRLLARRNIGVHLGGAVTEVGADYVRLDQGLEFASDAVFWATGGGAPAWIGAAGLATDPAGFLLTDAHLRSVSHPDVFGAGDCATQRDAPHARAGVFAVRAGPALAANLRAALTGGALAPHRPGRRYLALVSTGRRHAVGVWNGFAWQGDWVWRWKDRIDRAFVARYRSAGSP